MPGGKDVTLRVQTLGGTWENVGTDRNRGIWAENVQLAADQWGSSTASCDLHRSSRIPWPDIGAFTPAEFEIGGVIVWSGRIKETPTRDGSDRVMNLQFEGWQFHLDDDLYQRTFVHNRIDGWRDLRSYSDADLTIARATGQVQTGNGAMVLQWAVGETVQNQQYVGVVLDFGQGDDPARRIVFTYDWIGASAGASYSLYARAGDTIPALTATANDALAAVAHNGTSGNAGVGTFPTPGRYVMIFMYYSGTTGTANYDVGVRIRDPKVFVDTAYESSNVSILKAPSIITKSLDRATALLSSDRSQIATTTFSIPEFAPTDLRTPREMWDAANAYHNYASQIDVQKRPVFKALPAAPSLEVGEWSAMEFEDASANSGEDIYNRVVVSAQTPSGVPLRVERYASALAPLTQLTVTTDVQPTNPSFDTNTTGWSTASGGEVRDTASFDTSPASLRYDGWNNSNAQFVTGTTSGTFKAGTTYVVSFRVWMDSGPWQLTASVAGYPGVAVTTVPATTWTTVSVSLTPTTALVSPAISIKNIYRAGVVGGSVHTMRVDSVRIYKAAATIPDRRNFRRTKVLNVSSRLPDDGIAAAQIGDVWLSAHRTTPFRGTVKLTGNSAREILTGTGVPPERLLLRTQELLRFSDRVDPDTGAWGRDGRIAGISYIPATDEATVTIDSTRKNVEALLARLGALTGGDSS